MSASRNIRDGYSCETNIANSRGSNELLWIIINAPLKCSFIRENAKAGGFNEAIKIFFREIIFSPQVSSNKEEKINIPWKIHQMKDILWTKWKETHSNT